MSKSHKSERSRILITDSAEEIRSKISSALTDSIIGVSYDPESRPGISNLLDICSMFDAQSRSAADLADDFAHMTPKMLKESVADTIITGLDGIRSRYQDLMGREDGFLEKVEAVGAEKARKSAEETMDLVKTAIGF